MSYLDSMCKSKVIIKLQGSQGSGNTGLLLFICTICIYKSSWSALGEAVVGLGHECWDLVCLCIYHYSTSWAVAVHVNCLPQENTALVIFLGFFYFFFSYLDKTTRIVFHCTIIFLSAAITYSYANYTATELTNKLQAHLTPRSPWS